MGQLKTKLELKNKEDWKKITKKEINKHGGESLLKKYSIFQLKCFACPEVEQNYFKESNKNQKDLKYWEDKENIKNFLNKLKLKLNLKKFEDWEKITNKQIIKEGGNNLLKKYKINELKAIGFPEGNFTSKKTSGYWNKNENIANFINKLREKLNLETINDWNKLNLIQIRSLGGRGLLNKYSLYEIKCLGNKEGKDIYKKSILKKENGYWKNDENFENIIGEIKEKLNLNSFEDWNLLTGKQIKEIDLGKILKFYSLYDIKCKGFPDGVNQFKKPNSYKTKGFWNDNKNIQNFLFDLKEKLNLNTKEDWNLLNQNQIIKFGGCGLLQKYSLYQLKCFGFPDGKDYFDKPIQYKSKRYWYNYENIQNFIYKLKETYQLNSIEDWNLLSSNQIHALGGSSLLKLISLYDIKCLGCPEGNSIFDKPVNYKSSTYWENNDNIQSFLCTLKENLNLQTKDDWNRISADQIIANGGWGLLSLYSMDTIRKKILDLSENTVHKRSSQRWLFLQVQKLFPHEEIVEDYFHSEISRETGFPVQFDIYLTQSKIAIEYHGAQHYEDVPNLFAPLEMYKNRDNEKLKLCKQFGINLVVIPYWWNNQLESLKETLNKSLNKVVN